MIRIFVSLTIVIQLLCIPLYAQSQAQAVTENKQEAQSGAASGPTTNFQWGPTAEEQAEAAKQASQKLQRKADIQPVVQAQNAIQVPTEEHRAVLITKRSGFSIDQSPLRKIARGAVNVSLGWVEIPRQMIKVNEEGGDISGVFWGPLKGFAYFIGRTAVGIYEMTTFLLPPYKTVVDPEFILSDEDDD
ncbi:MAG: exosortase system-associated protein, TIGR04073 family [Candidatus Omnitrophota bacterium]